MKWLDNKYSRHAVIYGALSPPWPSLAPGPPGPRLTFVTACWLSADARPATLLWLPGCSRGPQMHHIHHLLPSKLSARATKNIVRKRCLTASKELKQPLAVIHYWHRDTEGPQECCNDPSSLSDGLQSTQCMTISYNNPGPVMKILFTERPHIMQQGERIFQLGRGEIKWLWPLHALLRK